MVSNASRRWNLVASLVGEAAGGRGPGGAWGSWLAGPRAVDSGVWSWTLQATVEVAIIMMKQTV